MRQPRVRARQEPRVTIVRLTLMTVISWGLSNGIDWYVSVNGANKVIAGLQRQESSMTSSLSVVQWPSYGVAEQV